MRKWMAAGVLMVCAGLAQAAETDACAALAGKVLSEGRVESARLVAAAPPAVEEHPMHAPYPATWILPEHCSVHAVMHARKGADGADYGVHLELNLPTAWNGKLLFQGGGGTDGVVSPALGIVNSTDAPALMRGYAVVSTDSGHTGGLAFGREQQARLDYAYQAIGTVIHAAKELVAAHYKRAAERSYFMGCSNGGRAAMLAVERYPLEFDGAIAGDPGFRLSRAAVAEAWDTESFLAAAPRNEAQQPVLSRALTEGDLKLLVGRLLERCDGLDGLRDGEINNRAACHFDPEELLCAGSKTATCLSRAQIDALHRVFGGAHDGKGNALYSSWPYDAGLADMGWRIWKLGTSETGAANAVNATFGVMTLKEYFIHPYRADFDPAHVDWDRVAADVAETGALNDAVSTDLSSFAARGGKLIVYEGMSDPVFSANDLISAYEQWMAANGGQEKTRETARLFLVPGMAHCGGGPSTDEFDALTALEQWAEAGKAPERIVARGRAFPGRTRPLCAYPQYAAYDGKGASEDAKSFECRQP